VSLYRQISKISRPTIDNIPACRPLSLRVLRAGLSNPVKPLHWFLPGLVSIDMVSAVDTRPMNDDDVSMDTIVPKTEAAQDGHVSMSSSVSTPEPEEQNQDVAQTQKRKGGRKPVCCRAHTRSLLLLIPDPDLCHIRRAQAEEPAGSSCFSRKANRVHQTAGDHHQAK
jgi:hypothetical protein